MPVEEAKSTRKRKLPSAVERVFTPVRRGVRQSQVEGLNGLFRLRVRPLFSRRTPTFSAGIFWVLPTPFPNSTCSYLLLTVQEQFTKRTVQTPRIWCCIVRSMVEFRLSICIFAPGQLEADNQSQGIDGRNDEQAICQSAKPQRKMWSTRPVWSNDTGRNTIGLRYCH